MASLQQSFLYGIAILFALTACTTPTGPTAPPPFSEPEVLRSSGGQLDTELVVAYADNQIGDVPVQLRSYNGEIVGPTLRVKPGDTLRLHLRNSLPDTEHEDHSADPNVPHGFNVTNIHTHGLHVSPSGNSDNVLISIGPGESFQYEFEIPADHPAGTFWYHAHRHGSVALQVASGMSGALIVEGGVDAHPAVAPATERLFVFQQIPYEVGEDGVGRVESYDVFRPGQWELSGHKTTINGTIQPLIEMRPQGVQRWRMVHAGVRETLMLKALRCDESWKPVKPEQAVPLHEIATDGFTRYEVAAKREVELQPGYRSDVLARFAEAGNYCLVDESTSKLVSLFLTGEKRALLARIRVGGTPKPMALPASDLRAYAPYPTVGSDELTGYREVEFDVKLVDKGRFEFLINGAPYDPEVINHTLGLNAVEEWALSSKWGNHPFHLHVNPFQVEEDGNLIWRDTILVRPRETVKIRSRYTDYTGKSVLHCHILDHEDQGMMQLVEIVP